MTMVAAGLIQMELSRGDGSLGTLLGVQAGLAMRAIAMLGSYEHKQRWLPPMARMEKLGAFASCSCVRGYACPVCNHKADAHVAAEPDLLIEILSPDVIVGFE